MRLDGTLGWHRRIRRDLRYDRGGDIEMLGRAPLQQR